MAQRAGVTGMWGGRSATPAWPASHKCGHLQLSLDPLSPPAKTVVTCQQCDVALAWQGTSHCYSASTGSTRSVLGLEHLCAWLIALHHGETETRPKEGQSRAKTGPKQG